MFKKHELMLSLEKTEVVWVGQLREELNTRVEGKVIKQGDGLCTMAEWLQKIDVRR